MAVPALPLILRATHSNRAAILLLALLPLFMPAPLSADPSDGHMLSSLPEYRVEDSAAAAVTVENLLESERFWPYRVELNRPWQPKGSDAPLRVGSAGVLIRVEGSGVARIDFGRAGLHNVPIAETNLVETANRIRRGELEKGGPNFLLAIGPRLIDSAASSLRPFRYTTALDQRIFLCVFADTSAGDFAELASALAPLSERDGVLTILFPQGKHSDAQVREELRSIEWRVPFVFDHLSEAYTRSLLDKRAALPALLLQTPEGRVLFQSSWEGDSVSRLTLALDEAYGRAPATHSSLSQVRHH